MRYKETYSLTSRTLKNGKKIFYYYVYDENGKRLKFSTGQSVKTKAREYCNQLYKLGKLIPERIIDITFSEYAENWWLWDKCEYIAAKVARGNSISKGYVNINRINLEHHVIPEFGKSHLKDITPHQIEKWFLSIPKKKKKNKEPLSNRTANYNLQTLRIMLNEAVRRGLIESNPAEKIKPLVEKPKIRGILSIDEFRSLFNPDTATDIWSHKLYYLGNLLSAVTGMRQGEVIALQSKNIHTDYIHVEYSWDTKYGLKGTKTNNTRDIPIPKYLFDMILQVREHDPNSYLFSFNGGVSPFSGYSLRKDLKRSLIKIGLKEEYLKERNITFHSWRHFFNTNLRSGGISDSKTQRLTGHRTQEMTERYTKFSINDYSDVRLIQDNLLKEGDIGSV